MAWGWSRSGAARSYSSLPEASFIRVCSWPVSSSALPSRKRATSSTDRRYSSCGTLYTQGAGQRLIWYCRQGRRRFAITESVQVRSWKWRFTMLRVSRVEDAPPDRPKERAPSFRTRRATPPRGEGGGVWGPRGVKWFLVASFTVKRGPGVAGPLLLG